MLPFSKRWIYHPDQKGSASLKNVLPAFTDLNYEDLEIGNGSDAMRLYKTFLEGKLEKKSIRYTLGWIIQILRDAIHMLSGSYFKL